MYFVPLKTLPSCASCSKYIVKHCLAYFRLDYGPFTSFSWSNLCFNRWPAYVLQELASSLIVWLQIYVYYSFLLHTFVQEPTKTTDRNIILPVIVVTDMERHSGQPDINGAGIECPRDTSVVYWDRWQGFQGGRVGPGNDCRFCGI